MGRGSRAQSPGRGGRGSQVWERSTRAWGARLGKGAGLNLASREMRTRSCKARSLPRVFVELPVELVPFCARGPGPTKPHRPPRRANAPHRDDLFRQRRALCSPTLRSPPPPPQPPSPWAASGWAGRGRGGVSGGAGPKGGVAKHRGQICERRAECAAEKAGVSPDPEEPRVLARPG